MKGQTGSEVTHLCFFEPSFEGIAGPLGVVVGPQPVLNGTHPGEGHLQALHELLLLLLCHDQSWA